MTRDVPLISGDTRLVAIVGDPIAQARSPALFNRLFAEGAMEAVLVPMRVAPGGLAEALQGLKRIGNLAGIVVTVPHKSACTSLVDALGPVARRVGAINCIRPLPDGRWEGEMFDGEGFVSGLKRQGLPPAGQRVFQAGCGGAGKAVADALLAAGAAQIDLVDTSKQLELALVTHLQVLYPHATVRSGSAPGPEHDLVVNATPCGMAADDPLPFDPAAARPDAVVADLIMKPERTRLLERALSRGQRIHLGRHLLESQALLVIDYLGITARPAA